jgi:hypothetical protein
MRILAINEVTPAASIMIRDPILIMKFRMVKDIKE